MVECYILSPGAPASHKAGALFFRGCLITYVKSQGKKYEMDLYLRRRSIAVAM